MNKSRSKRPLYVQIKNALKDRILHGLYPIDANIPSEPQLEEEFGVSKITVRAAIKELVQEGYLETGSGRGTRVVRNTPATKRSTWKRFTEVLVEGGHRIDKELLGIETVRNAAESVPHRLFGERCLRIERLYRLDGAPYIHYTHYLPAQLGSVKPAELRSQSLYGWLEERGAQFAKFRDEFAVASAPEPIAALLALAEPSAPLLVRRRYGYGESGELVEFSEGYYRAEMHPYVVDYDV